MALRQSGPSVSVVKIRLRDEVPHVTLATWSVLCMILKPGYDSKIFFEDCLFIFAYFFLKRNTSSSPFYTNSFSAASPQSSIAQPHHQLSSSSHLPTAVPATFPFQVLLRAAKLSSLRASSCRCPVTIRFVQLWLRL